MTERRISLPKFAEVYIAASTRRHAERVVVLFHGWLLRTSLRLRSVSGKDVDAFVTGPMGTPVKQLTRNNYRYEIRLYLRWLEERGLAGPFSEEELEGYHRRPLPDDVRRFLQRIAPIRRGGTIKSYRHALRRFREWMESRKLSIDLLDRDACLEWGQHLHELGLHPATRVGMLVCVRAYLDWLWEQGAVGLPGRDLIRSTDLPKKPVYLPRPLPPAADRELQDRLKNAESPVARGLYVMRRTGLRIGELRRLERDCVRDDHNGNQFLKVPLGKLNTERLVPLDPETLRAVKELQQAAPTDSQWLVQGARARPVAYWTYQSALAELGGGLALSEPLTTHRLRHTYATSLINGGMSLSGIQKLLGHHDHRMTLRYTQIADETVGREYFEALSRITERYELVQDPLKAVGSDPVQLLQDVIRWVGKHLCSGELERPARLVIRRLETARDALMELKDRAPPTEA
jgi:site-specific recombinase XerD